MPSDSKKKRDAKRKEGAKSSASNGTSSSASGNLKNGNNIELTAEGIMLTGKKSILHLVSDTKIVFNYLNYCMFLMDEASNNL